MITAILLGFSVSVLTGLIIGTERAKRYPGGAIVSGLLMAYHSDVNAFVLMLCGAVGYVLYIGICWVADHTEVR